MNTKSDRNDRTYWLESLNKIAHPVLTALTRRELKQSMPVEMKKGTNRDHFSHLEAMARLLAGMAPWLEGEAEGEEEQLREYYGRLAREAISAGTDPDSPDYMNFEEDYQPIVDTAFLAQAILRAPIELWQKLDDRTKSHVADALKATRTRKPFFSNWLLFSAIIEAALYKIGEPDWDPVRVDYALKQMEQWYAGDGMYNDGPLFRFDYYNSYVIHPMLVDIIEAVGPEYSDWKAEKEEIMRRARRYAAIQERLISPEGTFPPTGRSLAYRFGAFHLLAQQALRRQLPDSISPEQIRCALTAVMKRTMEAAGTFTDEGWLTIGFCGHQPDIGEGYISTGSAYLCSLIFLPLGLPASDSFWSGPHADWTARKAWSGETFSIDQALKD
ncbi:DUF2264 domain-containing protein [Sediminibacillus massiliensis]|uniref:DUF2264 domain-containing protein n=1 Tax=Sediminibacillus massiliensis TaxID=1926277 RepID=UPI000988490C|nr:DUF2264 domain-containing protein [Sediminibacillus massiliensis]